MSSQMIGECCDEVEEEEDDEDEAGEWDGGVVTSTLSGGEFDGVTSVSFSSGSLSCGYFPLILLK